MRLSGIVGVNIRVELLEALRNLLRNAEQLREYQVLLPNADFRHGTLIREREIVKEVAELGRMAAFFL